MAYKLLILGNGFDRHCGLESSYEEFFKQEIIDEEGEKLEFYNTKVGVDGFWEQLLVEYYGKYHQTSYYWSDVEGIIQKTLSSLFLNEKNSTTKTYGGIVISALYYVKNNKVYLHPKVDLNNSITKFLFNYCVNFFEKPTIKDGNDGDKKIVQKLIDRLLSELHNFEKRFCQYLKRKIFNAYDGQGINTDYIVNAVNLLAQLTGFACEKFNNIDEIVMTSGGRSEISLATNRRLSEKFDNLKNTYILSFNYTALFDILLVGNPCVYNNVHGKLCNKRCSESCSDSSVIFGVDDKFIQSQNEYENLRVFSKTYRKLIDMKSPSRVLPPNSEMIDIIFYGHSLSEADYSYFQSIFDHYNLYSNSLVTLYFYYSEQYNPTDAVYRLINEYGKTLTNKDQGKNLMHKLLLENRIKIVKIDR